MSRAHFLRIVFLLLLSALHATFAFETASPGLDKCGFHPVLAKGAEATAAPEIPKWGYGYDSLLADLSRWGASPHVTLDSIGASVEGRAIWRVTVTESIPLARLNATSSVTEKDRERIFIHARTHPAEVQTSWIIREMMSLLLGENEEAIGLRDRHIIHLIPMLNPDGVELEKPRENANDIDLESNWNKDVLEPEVAALKSHFIGLMEEQNPIRVALNLHSDQFNCTRFFFFHHANGTSEKFVELQKNFIGKVREYFSPGIEPWHFVVSWQGGTGLQYPEGFFWSHYRESVMALTFEDANCPTASEFDSTARALLLGAADYAREPPQSIRRPAEPTVWRALPLPGGIRLAAPSGQSLDGVFWELTDAKGRRLASGVFKPDGFLPIQRQFPVGSPVFLGLDAKAGKTVLKIWGKEPF